MLDLESKLGLFLYKNDFKITFSDSWFEFKKMLLLSPGSWNLFSLKSLYPIPETESACCYRWDDGGAQSLRRDIPVSEWYRVSRVLGGPTVGHHLLRQLRPGHADGLPVHHSGGLDGHALLGKLLRWRNKYFHLNSISLVFITHLNLK